MCRSVWISNRFKRFNIFQKKSWTSFGVKEKYRNSKDYLKCEKRNNLFFYQGFFDTDGGIYLEKKNKKLYLRIQIVNYSNKIMFQLGEVLKNIFNFNLCLYLDKNINIYRIIIGEIIISKNG